MCATLLLTLRRLSSKKLAVLALLPLLYALLGNRTKRLGKLSGKSVLITGASQGLGRAIAIECCRRGARLLFVVARDQTALQNLADTIHAIGMGKTQVIQISADLSTPTGARAVASRALSEVGGGVDLLVNNAGAGAWKHIEDTSPEEGLRMMAVPYQAAFSLTSLLMPHLSEREGHVLNITSAASLSAFRGAVGYAVARAAVRSFSQHLGRDVADLNVGVTLLNAAELAGTSYFSDAPGRAGSASQRMIPDLFQLLASLGVTVNVDVAASAALDGVQEGWSEVMLPSWLMVPSSLIAGWVPALFEAIIGIGPAGRRPKALKAA